MPQRLNMQPGEEPRLRDRGPVRSFPRLGGLGARSKTPQAVVLGLLTAGGLDLANIDLESIDLSVLSGADPSAVLLIGLAAAVYAIVDAIREAQAQRARLELKVDRLLEKVNALDSGAPESTDG